MKRVSIAAILMIAAALAALGGAAISAQDKYGLQVPGGLAFSEFKGYEDWQIVAVSHNGDKLAIILGNPAMIEAYKAGIPGNGKSFPDGARMAKIHWMCTGLGIWDTGLNPMPLLRRVEVVAGESRPG